MKLEVISDPFGSVNEGGDWPDPDPARYDEELLKPALLLSDDVLLRTRRMDALESVIAEEELFAQPISMLTYIRGILASLRHESPHNTPFTSDQITRLQAAANRAGLTPELGDFRIEKTVIDAMMKDPVVQEFAAPYRERLAEGRNHLDSSSIDALVLHGAVTVEAWDNRKSVDAREVRWRRFFYADGPEGSTTYGFRRIEAAMSRSTTPLMLDPLLMSTASDSGRTLPPDSLHLRNATELLRLVDEISSAPITEVVEVREELGTHLVGFRSFILKHADNFDCEAGLPAHELHRVAQIYWEQNVAPELEDLIRGEKASSLRRNVARVISEGPDSAISVGLSLVSSFAANAVGVSALVGVGIGSLPILVKAAAATQEARRQLHANAAYFLVKARRRLSRP